MVPVLNDGTVVGVVTAGNMTKCILAGRARPDDSVEQAGVIYKTFHKFSMTDTLARVASALDHDPFVLIATEQRCYSGLANTKKRRKLSHDGSASVDKDDGATSVDTAESASTPAVVSRCVVSGIVTRIDLLDFVSKGE